MIQHDNNHGLKVGQIWRGTSDSFRLIVAIEQDDEVGDVLVDYRLYTADSESQDLLEDRGVHSTKGIDGFLDLARSRTLERAEAAISQRAANS